MRKRFGFDFRHTNETRSLTQISSGTRRRRRYYAYSNFLYPPLVTTSYASVAPVSEAVYGTGTVEPERAKVVAQRRRLVELCRCEGQVVRAGQVLGRQDDAEERSALDQMVQSRPSNATWRAEKDRDKSDAARTEYEQR